MNSTAAPISSPLDDPPAEFAGRPFFSETVTLLRSVRDHDFETLAALCDDDYGIIDIAPDGGSVPIRTRDEWEAWFHNLFGTLDELHAATDSEITGYEASAAESMGYSVLDFRQTLSIGPVVATFDCIATIIWKLTGDGWREARWHCSVIQSDVPPELVAAPEAADDQHDNQ